MEHLVTASLSNFSFYLLKFVLFKVIVHDSIRSLINLSGEQSFCAELADTEFLKTIIYEHIIVRWKAKAVAESDFDIAKVHLLTSIL